MNKYVAWIIALVSTFVALLIFGVVLDIGKHLYPESNGARSDALYSLAIGALAFALIYGELKIWRLTQKARTGKTYLSGNKLSSKNIGQAGFTELMLASSRGDMQKITELLAKGVDVNAQEDAGKSALMFASMNGKVEVVVLLMQIGANPSLITKLGHNAAWFASNQGFDDIVSILSNSQT